MHRVDPREFACHNRVSLSGLRSRTLKSRIIRVVAFIGLVMGGIVSLPSILKLSTEIAAASGAQSNSRQVAVADKQPRDDERVVPVMWEEPVDLESRDLFYGIGGKKGEPDPTERFRFLGTLTNGHSEKIQVQDSKDRKWKVKFGEEPRPETVASRIVWAVGYHTDEDYYVDQANVEGRGVVRDVRFERDNDGFKKVDRWDWNHNPFVGTRELDGLKVLMALVNNFDLKTENNKIVSPKKQAPGGPVTHIYYVNDLGATLGSTGKWFGRMPLFGEAPTGSKGSPRDFADQDFIDGVHNGIVTFRMKRTRAQRAITGVKVENARWIGNLLARLSDRQLADAFRAGHYSDETIQLYVRALHGRISQLKMLR